MCIHCALNVWYGSAQTFSLPRFSFRDVLCGRLQCTHVNKIPKMLTGQSVVQTPVEGTFCWGFERHIGQHVYDLGAVRDGTTCGPDKVALAGSLAWL